jgi:hypothetical protein
MRTGSLTGIAAGLSALALFAGSAAAQTAPTYSSRSTTYFVDVSGGLPSAVTSYYNTIEIFPNATASGPLTFRTGHFNEYISTTGDVTTTYTIPAPGVGATPGSINGGANGGSFQFGYQTNNGPDFTASWTQNAIAFGHHVLSFSGGGTNLDDVGQPYDLLVAISGNWSTAGTATGDHTFLGIDPSFTVIQDFVYDSGLNETFFTAHATYTGNNPNLAFDLVGPPVPEPATWSLLILGFGAIGMIGRRRARVAA